MTDISIEGYTESGFTVVTVACRDDLRDTLCAIGRALDFPSYYGRNLDAMIDCLRDLDQPTMLELTELDRLAAHDPEGPGRLQQALADAVEEHAEDDDLVEFIVRYRTDAQ